MSVTDDVARANLECDTENGCLLAAERAKVARLREALTLGWEAMDSADFFRALSLNATTAALCQRAKEAMKVALDDTAPEETP